MPGLILAAPSSGCGKTTITLGLLRALKQRGVNVHGAKSGPDCIDPRFHEAASGAPCLNLDAWAMSPARIRALAATDALLLIEGAMGLFDGAPPDGRGATADLARILGLPVVLIVDAERMAQSVAPLVQGFARHDPDISIAGLILNRVGSERHELILRKSLTNIGIPVLGVVHRQTGLAHPSRHLGLVQAQERPDLEAFLNIVAAAVGNQIDLNALVAIAAALPSAAATKPMPPPAQRIALAQDAAFAFAYPHLLRDWRDLGAEILPFSPLNNQPAPAADMIFLPGGYPELYAGQISSNTIFLNSLKNARQDTVIHGECGGYMVLGEGLTDADGTRHSMAGLLPLETSFAERRLHLGYRRLRPLGGPFNMALNAHEFHYATTLRAEGPALYEASDAEGSVLPPMGLRAGHVSGSFAHVIDRAV